MSLATPPGGVNALWSSTLRSGVFAEILSRHELVPTERGVWLMLGSSTIEYGWKLHLSSVQSQARQLLDVVLPFLRESRVPFKIARDAIILGMLNEGALGDTQVGKFITIYPADGQQALQIATGLLDLTGAFSGPQIDTDRWLGGIVYARFGPFNPQMRRNRLGLFEPIDSRAAELASYRVPFTPPEGLNDPFIGLARKDEVIDAEADKDPRPIGPGYLITRVLSNHSKGSVYEALDLRERSAVGIVVLKQGRRHRMSDLHGRAMQDRLANEAAAQTLANLAGVAPKAHDIFSYGDSVFLPVDFVRGMDLGARPSTPYARLKSHDRRELLEVLSATGRAVLTLHQVGVVHRDLSMRNIRVTPGGKVMLLDFEIAHVLNKDGDRSSASPPFMQGTPGFVSPQQLAEEDPSIADDVYSLGAVLICALTGLDPQRVTFAQFATSSRERAHQIGQLSGAPMSICRVAAQCVDPDPSQRPSIDEVVVTLSAKHSEFVHMLPPLDEECERAAVDGARWLLMGAKRDEQSGMWLSPDIEGGTHGDIRLIHAFKLYRSANVGVSGVVYLLAKLHRFGFETEGTKAEVGRVVDWLLLHAPTSDDQLPGLHFGETGVAVAIAEALAAGLIERGPWTANYFREVMSAPIDWPDLAHGAAGQGLGALECARLIGGTTMSARANHQVSRCVEYLCESQGPEGAWTLPEGTAGMSGQSLTGYAHGAAGALAFLSHPKVYPISGAARAAAERTANWLFREVRAGEGGLYLWWPMATGDHVKAWTWWCHGAPGVALGLLARYVATGDDRCAGAVRAALRSHPFEARSPNLGQCHGLSGVGEIYLDAFEVFGEDEWYDRAMAIGRLLLNLARRDEFGASWLVENPYVPTPDLMIGTAGVVHFLARLARPGKPFGSPLSPRQI